MADQPGARGELAKVGPYDGPGSEEFEKAAGQEGKNKPAHDISTLPEQVDVLQEDGSITQEDIDRLMEEIDGPAEGTVLDKADIDRAKESLPEVAPVPEPPKKKRGRPRTKKIPPVETKNPYSNPKDNVGVTKVAMNLVPPAAKIYLAQALGDGAAKYGPYNWRDNMVVSSIYLAACERHLDAYLDGEDLAQDSGVHHLAHAMACLAIMVDAAENGMLDDDRPTKGSAGKLQEKLRKK